MEIHAERTSLAELIENIVVVITPLVKEKTRISDLYPGSPP